MHILPRWFRRRKLSYITNLLTLTLSWQIFTLRLSLLLIFEPMWIGPGWLQKVRVSDVSHIKHVKISVNGSLTGELDENAHLYIENFSDEDCQPWTACAPGSCSSVFRLSGVCQPKKSPPPPPPQRSDKKKNTFISPDAVHNPLSQERVKFLEKSHQLCDHSLSNMGQ